MLISLLSTIGYSPGPKENTFTWFWLKIIILSIELHERKGTNPLAMFGFSVVQCQKIKVGESHEHSTLYPYTSTYDKWILQELIYSCNHNWTDIL